MRNVVFFADRKKAEAFEARCFAKAIANGQKCDRWAEIIESEEGFGVPVKERIASILTVAERQLVKDLVAKDGLLPI